MSPRRMACRDERHRRMPMRGKAETDVPETHGHETDVPETDAPETDVPETEEGRDEERPIPMTRGRRCVVGVVAFEDCRSKACVGVTF